MLWGGLILGMSSVPGSQLQEVRLRIPDKLVHFSEYALFGALVFRASAGRGRGRAVLVALLMGAALGAVDESYQRLIPQRDSSAWDWTADLLGSVAGAALMARHYGRALCARRRPG